MTWYVAIVALVNLGLGYALAVFLAAEKRQPAHSWPDALDATEAEEWESEPVAVA